MRPVAYGDVHMESRESFESIDEIPQRANQVPSVGPKGDKADSWLVMSEPDNFARQIRSLIDGRGASDYAPRQVVWRHRE
jgi:hypothetical protein